MINSWPSFPVRSWPLNSRWPGLACVMVMAMFLTGCGQKKPADASAPAAPAADQTQSAAPAPQPEPVTPAVPATVAAAPGGGADLRDLNHAYIRWVIQSHRRAKTFEEFAASSGINVPPPPAGKKYVIDHAGFIAIQNQ